MKTICDKEIEKEVFTKAQENSIKIGLKQAENGQLKPHSQVMKKARELCGM